MNEPIEILTSDDENDVIELLSDDDMVTSTQTTKKPTKRHNEVYEMILSSPEVSKFSPLPLQVTRKQPLSTKILDDIVNMGSFTDSDSDEAFEAPTAKAPTSDSIDLLKRLGSRKESPKRSLFNEKLFVSEDETNDSIVSASKELITLQSPIRQSPSTKETEHHNIIIDDESDYENYEDNNNVIIGEHNVLLSSSPDHHVFEFGDSSSIGNVVLSKAENSKPLISRDLLDKVDHSEPKRRRVESVERVYKEDSNNPFLNSLKKNDLENRKKLERLRKDKTKEPSSPISRSITDPKVTLPLVLPKTTAIRAQTFDSARTTKEDREILKSQKEQEKRSKKLYQELNKSKRTKEELLSEMIIEIPKKLITIFQSINYKEDLEPIQVKESSNDDNSIRWLRKSNSKYDSEMDCFQPADFHLIEETKLCFVFTAKEFIEDIEIEDDIIENFKSLKRLNESTFDNILIMIIGLEAHYSKLKNQENREFQERVRNNLQTEPTTATTTTTTKKKPKNSKDSQSRLSIEEIESTIAQLQINGFKTFPTRNVHETVQWLKSFTYTISSARYDKYERNQDLAHIGVIKSGQDTKDTYSKMLQHFKLMTGLKAERIMDEYPTVKELYEGVINGHRMIDSDGKKIMSGNIEIGLKKLFSTYDDKELLQEN